VNAPDVADGVLLLSAFNTVHAVFTKADVNGHEAECRQNRRAEMVASGVTLVLGYTLMRVRGSGYPMLFAVVVCASLIVLYESAARWPEKWA
jgi:hypothetical protein